MPNWFIHILCHLIYIEKWCPKEKEKSKGANVNLTCRLNFNTAG